MYKYLANTLFTGKNIIRLTSCHSTNTIAREMAQKDEQNEGTIIITDNQTAGKGQRGSLWESAPGENLTFSVIYKPVFLNSSETFFLNIITSLALVNALKSFGLIASIKWPNDIFCGDYKISGILIENVLERDIIKKSIIGIGLNVNQALFRYPQATSMFQISNRLYDLKDVFEAVVPLLEQYYLKLKSGNKPVLLEQYHNALLGKGEERIFSIDGQEVKGTILGIDNIGRLKIDISGKILYFSFKEIKFVF